MIDKIFETHMKIISEEENSFIIEYKTSVLPLLAEYSKLQKNFKSLRCTICEGVNPDKLAFDQIEAIFNTALKMKMKDKMSSTKDKLISRLSTMIKKNPDIVEPEKIDKLAYKLDNLLDTNEAKKVNYLASRARKNKKISSLVASILGTVLSVKDEEKTQVLNQGVGIVNDAMNGKIDPTLDVNSISNIIYGKFGGKK